MGTGLSCLLLPCPLPLLLGHHPPRNTPCRVGWTLSLPSPLLSPRFLRTKYRGEDVADCTRWQGQQRCHRKSASHRRRRDKLVNTRAPRRACVSCNDARVLRHRVRRDRAACPNPVSGTRVGIPLSSTPAPGTPQQTHFCNTGWDGSGVCKTYWWSHILKCYWAEQV